MPDPCSGGPMFLRMDRIATERLRAYDLPCGWRYSTKDFADSTRLFLVFGNGFDYPRFRPPPHPPTPPVPNSPTASLPPA